MNQEGLEGVGQGPQETFINCADVVINTQTGGFAGYPSESNQVDNPWALYFRGSFPGIPQDSKDQRPGGLKPLIIRYLPALRRVCRGRNPVGWMGRGWGLWTKRRGNSYGCRGFVRVCVRVHCCMYVFVCVFLCAGVCVSVGINIKTAIRYIILYICNTHNKSLLIQIAGVSPY